MTIQYDNTDELCITKYNIIFTVCTTKVKGKASNHEHEK